MFRRIFLVLLCLVYMLTLSKCYPGNCDPILVEPDHPVHVAILGTPYDYDANPCVEGMRLFVREIGTGDWRSEWQAVTVIYRESNENGFYQPLEEIGVPMLRHTNLIPTSREYQLAATAYGSDCESILSIPACEDENGDDICDSWERNVFCWPYWCDPAADPASCAEPEAGGPGGGGNPDCLNQPTYLLTEGFENPAGVNGGYDSSLWTTKAHVDPDNALAPAPLTGSESLELSDIAVGRGNLVADFSDAGSSDVTIAFELNIPLDPGNNNEDSLFQLVDVHNEVQICNLELRNAYDGLSIIARGGGSQAHFNGIVQFGETLRIKIRRGVTVLNENQCELWATTSTTDWGPSVISTGSPGSFVAPIDHYRFYHESSDYVYLLDQVRIATVEIPICSLD